MKKSYVLYFIILCFFGVWLLNCTEPFKLKTESFEDVIVVEATITDELKKQEIKISRTYLLENDSPSYEKNANVIIEDSNLNTYDFSETSNGIYVSNIPFKAVEGVTYKLVITTKDGKKYVSSEELLAPKAEIDSLYAELVNVNGELGVQVLVDGNDYSGQAQFFRYEYEETYKIVVPYFSYYDVSFIFNDTTKEYDINFSPRNPNKEICYSSNFSDEIILKNTNGLAENKLSRFPIKFIPANSPTLRERYSINVKQYVQSANANNFYGVLKELGGDVSLLLDNQPGFIQGNLLSQQSSKEKIIGYFDVSSVTSKRIYFDYKDFDIDKPQYFYECDLIELDYRKTDPDDDERGLIIKALNQPEYFSYLSGINEIFQIVKSECGDCTKFSSNKRPEFWED